MKKVLRWGDTSYDILLNNNVILSNRKTACYAEFMNRFEHNYDTIRIYDIDCQPTVEYKNFFLQYVIDMYRLEGSFNDQYFEFKSQGNKIKDAVVMSTVRLLWESFGGNEQIDTPTRLFKRLRDDKCRYRDKLKKFCHFYKELIQNNEYFSEGHSWNPNNTMIKGTLDYVRKSEWRTVNGFFTT